MDSDQDSSASDDWVVLDSCTSSSSDDDLVLALSSGCATPTSSASDSDADRPATDLAAAAAADEGFYAISDAEDDDDDADACPPPPAPVPMPLAGLFHHMVARGPRVSYAAFDPHHGAKRLVPDPTFSAFFHEAVSALASTRGLVCLRGERSKDYYVANPATFDRARLPRPNRDHFKRGDPAVVITFDLDNHDDFDFDDRRVVYRHYRVVVAFHLGEGIYAFESFSSRTWSWTIGAGVVEAETVVPLSGVGALGCAFWRTTMGHFICFEPVSGCSDLVPAPMEVTEWPHWELGEMEGRLCATCTDDRVSAVVVICLDLAARRTDTGHVAWTLAGHFEGGCLRGRQDVTLLRSQGKAEVVMWDRRAEAVVAMDLEGRTTRTISMPSGTGYYADFIPYIATLAAVSAHSSNVPRKECPRTTGTNEMGAECRAMAVDAEAY